MRGSGRRKWNLRARPSLAYLIIFILLMVPALLLFPAAGAGSRSWMAILLGLVAAANLLTLIL